MCALLRTSAHVRYCAVMARKRLNLPFDRHRLREQRELQGLTQTALAQRCIANGHRIDHTIISRLETGIFGPTPTRLKVLADALGLETADLLRRELVSDTTR